MNRKPKPPCSAEHKAYLKKRRLHRLAIRAYQVGVLVLFLGVWELAASLEWIDPFLYSSPSRVWLTVADLYNQGELFHHLGATLWETVISFLLATGLGTGIAVLMWCSTTLREVAEPYLVVLNALPKVALGPLIIIWAGAGERAIIVMALLISLIITIISMLQGFTEVEKDKIQLMRALGANRFQILTKLVLPANVPTLVSVLKINVGLSWVGTIMGEYLVSREGVGYLLVYGSQGFKLDLVMASTILLCLMATGMYLIVGLFEKLILKLYGTK